MAKHYNIADRLQGGKPVLKLSDEVEFKINNSLAAAVAIRALSEDEKTDDTKKLRKLAVIALGEDATKQLEAMDLSLPDWVVISEVIAAALQGVDLDEVKAPGKQAPPDLTSLKTGH